MQTQEIIVELLSQLGSSREAREYLKKFSQADSSRFAVIKVGGGVIQDELPRLSSAIGFLYHMGLFPIVIHGAGPQLEVALKTANIQSEKRDGIRVTTPEMMSVIRPVIYRLNLKLSEALDELGIRSRAVQHGVFECDYEDEKNLGLVGRVKQVHEEGLQSAIQSGTLPILTCLGETPGGQVVNINADVAATQLVMAIEPYKVIFLTPTGGLLDETGKIISAINLETDYQQLMDSEWVHSGMALKLKQIHDLLQVLPSSSSISITSAANLTRELFTYRGAGTLIRQGEGFAEKFELDDPLRQEVVQLLECCFQKKLRHDYFDHLKLRSLIRASSGRAAAVVVQGCSDVDYLDKFVVTPEAQGEGIGASLWKQIRNRFPQLYWRSRWDNPVNTWYGHQADFCIRQGKWRVFGYGVDDMSQINSLVDEAIQREEFWQSESEIKKECTT